MNPLFSLSQITLVDRKVLVSEWTCVRNSVITTVDKRPKNRLQLILIVYKKYLERKNVRYLVTVKLNDRTFIHLISEFSLTICSKRKSERNFKSSSTSSLSEFVQFGHLYRKLHNRNWRNLLKKGRMKSPCVSLEYAIRI